MKKMLVVIAVFVIFFVNSNKCDVGISLADYFDGEYYAYTSGYADDDGVDLGFCYMYSHIIRDNLIGESIRVYNLEIGNVIDRLDASVVSIETLDDGTVVLYCFTDRIKSCVDIGNTTVNLQIVDDGDYVVIGWPLILGSF